jgi:broad specificity phosphatase PhoE
MNDLYVIRHGHFDTTSQEATPLGKKQMKGVAARLHKANLDDIILISSSQKRAYSSAKSLATYLDRPHSDIEQWDELQEGQYKHNHKDIENAYQRLTQAQHNKPIAIVTHRNTGVSLINRVIIGRKYTRNIQRPFINMGTAIQLCSETRNVKFF